MEQYTDSHELIRFSLGTELRPAPSFIERKIVGVKGRGGLLLHDLDPSIAGELPPRLQDDDYRHLVSAHRGRTDLDSILGIHQEARRRFLLSRNGQDRILTEDVSLTFVQNVWVGDNVKLYTMDEAAQLEHAGRTALEWATVNNQIPDMVVRANNGFFYPATVNDVVVDPNYLLK